MKTKPEPGARVRYTEKWLASAGLVANDPSRNASFTVVPCNCGLCRNGAHVCTDDRTIDNEPRHSAFANLRTDKRKAKA